MMTTRQAEARQPAIMPLMGKHRLNCTFCRNGKCFVRGSLENGGRVRTASLVKKRPGRKAHDADANDDTYLMHSYAALLEKAVIIVS